eukprot:3782645-Rhodomonas_salina.1
MERDNVDEAVKRACKELMTQKRTVSNALHGSTGFRTMDSLEQLYPCGVRLRGARGDIGALLGSCGLLRSSLSPVEDDDYPSYSIQDNGDWLLDA